MPSEMSKRREHKINKLSKEVYKDKTPPASKDDVCYRCKGDRYIVVMGVKGKRGADQKTCPSCLGSGIRYVHLPHSSLRKIEEEAIIEGKSSGRKEVLKAMKKYFGLACHHDRDFMICPLCLKEFIKQEGGSDE